MPIYEYYCQNCDYIFEELNKGYTEKDMSCPKCGQNAKRLISNTSFILKGGGFYETDYKRKEANSENGNGKENAKGNGGEKAEKTTSSEKTTQKEESSSSGQSSESTSSQKDTSQNKE